MKLLIPVLLLFASSAQALVTDRFTCKLSILDLETNQSVENIQDFYIARSSLSATPSPDLRFTVGASSMSLTMSQKKSTVQAHVNFYYKHAVKLDALEKPIDARQFACVAISFSKFTDKPGSEAGQYSCKEPKDPFDSETGWTPSSLMEGVPLFNDRGSGAASTEIVEGGKKRAEAIFSCKYKGTYW